MRMTILGLPILGNLLTTSMTSESGGRAPDPHKEYVNQFWQNWSKKIDQMAKRRFPEDEALAMEAANYILLEKLEKDNECEKLRDMPIPLILTKISHWLADYKGHRRSPCRCLKKPPLCHEAIQLLLKRHLPKAEFYMATVVTALANEHPDVSREEIANTVASLRVYYMLAVYFYPRREVVEMLKVETSWAAAVVETLVTQVLQRCPPKMPGTSVPFDDLLDLSEEDKEALELPCPDETLLEQLLRQLLLQLGLALSILLGEAATIDDPEVQQMLNILQPAKLKDEEKQVLMMRYYHDMTAKEIANSDFGRQHGWTERKVFAISDAALKKLRKVLQNYLPG